MCGIVGYIGTSEKKYTEARQHFLRHALIMDTLRGKDSTGIISVYGKKFDVYTSRTTASGDKFVNTKQWNKIQRDGWATIGHNRAATHGEVKLANAHPFRFGPVALVHNGTLESKGQSLPTFDKGLEVDSMQIALALSEHEPGEADEVLSNIHGAFAIVWTDDRDETINMARNGSRPMHFTYNKAKDFMMFMSDGHMLTSINKSMWKTQAQGESIYSLDIHKHLKWKKGSLVPEVASFDPFRPKVTRPPQTNMPHTPTRATRGKAGQGTLMQSTIEAQRTLTGFQNGGDKRGKVPGPMLTTLAVSYELNPSMNLRFEPVETFNLFANTVMVHGYVYLEHWGNTPWPCVIYDVPAQSADTCMEQDWMVVPIGVTRPTLFPTSPSILARYCHMDWAGKSQVNDSLAKYETGPDGRLIEKFKLDQMLQAGCVNCACNLDLHDMDKYVYANEGTSLICEGCKWEESQ